MQDFVYIEDHDKNLDRHRPAPVEIHCAGMSITANLLRAMIKGFKRVCSKWNSVIRSSPSHFLGELLFGNDDSMLFIRNILHQRGSSVTYSLKRWPLLPLNHHYDLIRPSVLGSKGDEGNIVVLLQYLERVCSLKLRLSVLHLALDRSCDIGNAGQLHLHRTHLPRHRRQNDRIRPPRRVPQGVLAEVAYAHHDRGLSPFFVCHPTSLHPSYLPRPRRHPGHVRSLQENSCISATCLNYRYLIIGVLSGNPSPVPRGRCKSDTVTQSHHAPLSRKIPLSRCLRIFGITRGQPRRRRRYELVFTFFLQLKFTIPHISAFLRRTKRFGFDGIRINFWPDSLVISATPAISPLLKDDLCLRVPCTRLDFQVASVAQICRTLGPNFGSMEDLFVKYHQDQLPTHWRRKVDPTLCRELISQFRGIKTLWISGALISEVTASMRYDTLQLLAGLPILAWMVVEIDGDEASTAAARSLSALLTNVRGLGGPVIEVYPLFSDKWQTGSLPER